MNNESRLIPLLKGLWKWSGDLEKMKFSVFVEVYADWLYERLEIDLTFEEVMQEIGSYHINKQPETSVIPFDAHPFLDHCYLSYYHIYFLPECYEGTELEGISISTLQDLIT